MPLDFSLLGVNQPSVAERFAMGQQEAQRNQLAQQQLEQSRLQTQISRAQYDQMQRDRAALDSMAKAFAEQGHSGTLSENFDKMIASGIPQYVQIGITGKQKLAEQAQFASIMGGGAPAAAPMAAPGAPAMTPAPTAPRTNALMPTAEPAPAANVLAAPVAAPAAPAPAPAVSSVDAMRRKRDQLLALGTPQAIAAAKALDSDIVALSRQHVLAPGGVLVGAGGEKIASVPEKEPTATAVTEYNFAKSPAGEIGRAHV